MTRAGAEASRRPLPGVQASPEQPEDEAAEEHEPRPRSSGGRAPSSRSSGRRSPRRSPQRPARGRWPAASARPRGRPGAATPRPRAGRGAEARGPGRARPPRRRRWRGAPARRAVRPRRRRRATRRRARRPRSPRRGSPRCRSRIHTPPTRVSAPRLKARNDTRMLWVKRNAENAEASSSGSIRSSDRSMRSTRSLGLSVWNSGGTRRAPFSGRGEDRPEAEDGPEQEGGGGGDDRRPLAPEGGGGPDGDEAADLVQETPPVGPAVDDPVAPTGEAVEPPEELGVGGPAAGLVEIRAGLAVETHELEEPPSPRSRGPAGARRRAGASRSGTTAGGVPGRSAPRPCPPTADTRLAAVARARGSGPAGLRLAHSSCRLLTSM